MIVLNIGNSDRAVDVEFPCKESELQSRLLEIGETENSRQKVLVTEAVEPQGLSVLEGTYVDPDEINYLAKRMDSLTEEEKEKLYAVCEHEGFDQPKELINLTFNLDRYTLIQNLRNPAQVGIKHYLTINGGISQEESKRTDFERIGKDLLQSGRGVATEYGLLFQNEEVEWNEVYDGTVFPEYWYDGDKLFGVEIGCGGKKEYVYLPDEPQAITKAMNRLLASSQGGDFSFGIVDWNIDNDDWLKRFKTFLQTESIFDVNRLAESVSEAKEDLDKLTVLMKYAGDESLSTAMKLARNIEKFEYIAKADGYEEAARYLVDDSSDYIPPEIENFIDYEGFGTYFERKYGGKFIDGGFVYIASGETLREILDQTEDQAEQRNGIEMGGL